MASIASVEKQSNSLRVADSNEYYLPHWATSTWNMNFLHSGRNNAAMFDGRVVTLSPQDATDALWNPDALTK